MTQLVETRTMPHERKHWLTISWFLLALALLGLTSAENPLAPAAAWADDTQAAEGEDADSPVEEKPEEVNVQLDSPRAVMQTFMQSYHRQQPKRTAACFDFSKVKPEPNVKTRHKYAENLLAIIDRLAWVEYDKISDENEGTQYRWPPDGKQQPIVITRADNGTWQFDANMVENLPALYEAWKGKPVIVPWYRKILFGTELWQFSKLFLSLLLAWIIGRIAKSVMAKSGESLEKRSRDYTGTTLKALSRAVVPLTLVIGLSIGLALLRLDDTVQEICDTVVAVLYAIAVAYILYCLVDVIAVWLKHFSEKTESKLDDMLAPMVTTTARGTIIILALVQIATILSDKPMTSVIAGLGVGGLAIGLAAQDMIKNFFGSLMIFSDQPFQLGDRVVISGVDGTVEVVGFRSTQIRTLDGHLVTMPNGDVANTAVRNVTARPNIKRSFGVTVTYDTPPEKVQRAIEILNEILENHEGMDPESPPRVHFNDMTDIALSIQVIYWYHPPDYWAYCAFSQWVNFEILSRFNAEGIEFAFPTQTLFLAGDPNRPLNTTGA